jgi:hypothetical protein
MTGAPRLARVIRRLEISAAFLGLPEVRFVGLKDACHMLGLVPNGRLEEAVPPSERGTDSHPQLCGGFPDGQALLKALTVPKELLLRVKVGEWRVCRCVEGLRAILAAVTLDPSPDSVLDALEAIAVGTTGSGYRRVQDAQRMSVPVLTVRCRP